MHLHLLRRRTGNRRADAAGPDTVPGDSLRAGRRGRPTAALGAGVVQPGDRLDRRQPSRPRRLAGLPAPGVVRRGQPRSGRQPGRDDRVLHREPPRDPAQGARDALAGRGPGRCPAAGPGDVHGTAGRGHHRALPGGLAPGQLQGRAAGRRGAGQRPVHRPVDSAVRRDQRPPRRAQRRHHAEGVEHRRRRQRRSPGAGCVGSELGPGRRTRDRCPQPAVAVTVQHPGGAYFPSADSTWIWQDATGSAVAGSPYTFQLGFDLSGLDPASVSIGGAWGVDNDGTISFNGQPPTGTGTFSLTRPGPTQLQRRPSLRDHRRVPGRPQQPRLRGDQRRRPSCPERDRADHQRDAGRVTRRRPGKPRCTVDLRDFEAP